MTVAFRTIRELGADIRAGRLSPVTLAETCLEQLDTVGRALNAVVTLTPERALAQARRAERELAAGHDRGPLHGIPYGAKDLLATSGGIPTTWGAAPFRDRCFDYDATVIRRLDEAGAVLVAKLAMVEFAGGMGYRQPNASFTGPGITPWAADRWSGGSSSGSGSAVGAGLVPFAIGSETWGSILGPATYCSVSGLRPTYGRVSRHGAMALCWTLDKLGPLALTADDCGLVLDAVAGPDPLDATSAARTYRYDASAAERRFRFAVVRGTIEDSEPAVRDGVRSAVESLAQLGTVEEITLTDRPYEAMTRVVLWAEGASAFERLIEGGVIAGLTAPEDQVTPYARDAILAKDYLRALRLRGVVAREIDSVLSRFDAIVGPSRGTLGPRLGEEFRSATRGSFPDVLGAIGNAAGLPAIGVPCGLSADGLPIGMQFLGRAWDENTVLAAARAWQARTDWHLRRPVAHLPRREQSGNMRAT
jgi:aspartyl-tRNA(Asn)/glutamyl-tRNA(Gln) amidotransferase subunit A